MAKRLKLIIVAVLLCLSISVVFAGVASAKTAIASHPLTTHGPSINNEPSHVAHDPTTGCWTFLTHGKNWLPGDLIQLSFDGTLYGPLQGPVAADGTFTFTSTLCPGVSPFPTPGKHRIGANGFFGFQAGTDDVTLL